MQILFKKKVKIENVFIKSYKTLIIVTVVWILAKQKEIGLQDNYSSLFCPKDRHFAVNPKNSTMMRYFYIDKYFCWRWFCLLHSNTL